LYGKQETLADGSTISVDEAYLTKSILEPQFQIVKGFENVVMPPTGQNMSEQQINDVIEYIKSLGK
jgi:cytochrome c oxidase subunit 2